MVRDFVISLRSVLVLWGLTVVIYPLFILLFGQIFFPFQANGSLLTNAQGQVVGSALIGQSFTSDEYFWSRPSVIDYSETAEAAPTGLSGASNLAPSNPELMEQIEVELGRLQTANIQPTADLLYSSGSGLDPHISVAAAQAQVERIAESRALPVEAVQDLISDHTEGRFLGIFGEPGVNVLRLNLALDSDH
jgi:K+-transporting ATPase ATPase C chain